jgi:hypothetical protein
MASCSHSREPLAGGPGGGQGGRAATPLNLIFWGSPGTAETSVPRLLAGSAPSLGSPGFDNGRAVRNAFELSLRAQAGRLSELLASQETVGDDALRTLSVEDIRFSSDVRPLTLGFTADL